MASSWLPDSDKQNPLECLPLRLMNYETANALG
jgi:hypothetical protein